MSKVIGVAGFKNAGKTTLVEKLVTELTRRGHRVSTVKHAHHSFDIDHEGRDSFRHRKAGASEVAVVSRHRWAIIHESREEAEPTLQEILAKLAPCDLVIVEGYKRDSHFKVEAYRAETGAPMIGADDPTVKAIATNDVIEAAQPLLPLDDPKVVADFILREVGLLSQAAHG